jgi:ABC-type Fe3+/spermidine/putrescine transport system ATPase subunit
MKKIIALAGKRNILLRPEDINLGRKSNNTLRGKVQSTLFYGDHHEVEVLTGNQVLTINTGMNGTKPGDTVYISGIRGQAWYVDAHA